MASFLSNRQEYVYIYGMESNLINSSDCSVCQGSKLSSLLYILYSNEIPLLHNILNTDIHTRLTDNDILTDKTKIEQFTVQYIEDSSTMISTDEITDIETYIDNHFTILEDYHNANKLTHNQEKTKFMVVCKAASRYKTQKLVLNTANYVIEQCSKLKILGIYFTSCLSHAATVNNMVTNINFRLRVLKFFFSNILITERL